MEEERNDILNLLLHGCSLARDLESNLRDSTANNHPMILSHRCDEIIGVFSMVREKLTSMHPTPADHHLHHPKGKGKEVAHEVSMKNINADRRGQEESRGEAGTGGGRLVSSPRPRNPRRSLSRRGDEEATKRRVRVAAPQMGNTEVPPEDGFTWRKYGQKEILNAKHPRSYYRCTHQKFYGCPAKKQVQRLDDDPSTFEILYRGEHTCHMSPTAPSVPPPPSKAVQDMMILHHHPISAVDPPLLDWDVPLHGEGASSVFEPHQQALFPVTSCSSALGSIGAPAGSSAVGSHQQGMDGVDFIHHHQNPVLDFELADHVMMFNSGSSGSNSMEVIFPPFDGKKQY